MGEGRVRGRGERENALVHEIGVQMSCFGGFVETSVRCPHHPFSLWLDGTAVIEQDEVAGQAICFSCLRVYYLSSQTVIVVGESFLGQASAQTWIQLWQVGVATGFDVSQGTIIVRDPYGEG